MDFSEIRQAIDDVIKENGDNKITAKSLNLLLNNLVDVMEANAGGSNTNIMVCMGDTHKVGEPEPDGNVPGYITVTKEENLQRNIDAYNKIKECVENNTSFNLILDMYQLAKQIGLNQCSVYYFIPSLIIGIDQKIDKELFKSTFMEWGYDYTKYSNDIVYQIFKGSPSETDYLVLCPDGVVIGLKS